jgi:hypothetical protein
MLDTVLESACATAGVGEISFIGADWADTKLRCTCGEPYQACPVWHDVFNSAAEAREAHRIVRNVEGAAAIAKIERGDLSWELCSAYREVMHRTFLHAGKRLGAEVIVDSSKSARATAGRFLALSRHAGLDVKVLHLVRSGYATAASYAVHGSNWVQEGRIQPYAAMVPRAIAGWRLAHERVIRLLRLVDPKKQLRVKYEDLASDPVGTITAIGAFAGIDVTPAIDKLEHGEVFTMGHQVGGNRLRLQKDIVVKPIAHIRSERLGLLDRTVYGFAAAPLDKKFGYQHSLSEDYV